MAKAEEESVSAVATDVESGSSSPRESESGSSITSDSAGLAPPTCSKTRASEPVALAAAAASAKQGVQFLDLEASDTTKPADRGIEAWDVQGLAVRSQRCQRTALSLAAMTAQLEGESDEGQEGSACTSNVKTLVFTSCLFLSITVAQMLAAKVSHSRALMVDSISMGVDGLTFFCNIFVELRKRDGGEHLRSQLVVSAISLGFLTFFTIDALQESTGIALGCWGWVQEAAGGDEEDVNPYIVMAFALAGLAFDGVSLFAFWRSAQKSGASLNMGTALLHVGADFLRSATTLCMSLLILLAGMDGTCTDATASLLVGATILGGAASGFWSWSRKMVQFCRQGK